MPIGYTPKPWMGTILYLPILYDCAIFDPGAMEVGEEDVNKRRLRQTVSDNEPQKILRILYDTP
jgi:hypothetical protein